MPSLLGGIASAIVPLILTGEAKDEAGDPGTQLAGMGLTIAVAVCTGSVTGFLMKLLKQPTVEMADDSAHWEVADDFEAPWEKAP